jgi:hypothetical protein
MRTDMSIWPYQAVSGLRWLVAGFPPRLHGFDIKSGNEGIYDRQKDIIAGFLLILWFSLPILVLPTATNSSKQ